jgi:DNA-binding response OmpR family regulator
MVTNSARALKKASPSPSPKVPKVLLVDGDADTAEMYAVGLRMEGFAAAVANEPAMALEQLKRGFPDAVVVDVTDATREDWQILRWCKDGAGGCGRVLPVILLTGHPRTAIPGSTTELEGAALLLKPCLPETLAHVIRALLAGEDSPQGLDRFST